MLFEDIDFRLLATVWWLHERAGWDIERRLRRGPGCSLAQFKLMHATLSPDTNFSATDVARRLGRSKASVTKTMRELEGARLVGKLATYGDGRSHILRLTAGGQRAYDECVEELKVAAQSLFGALAPEEKLQLERLVRKAIARFRPAR